MLDEECLLPVEERFWPEGGELPSTWPDFVCCRTISSFLCASSRLDAGVFCCLLGIDVLGVLLAWTCPPPPLWRFAEALLTGCRGILGFIILGCTGRAAY